MKKETHPEYKEIKVTCSCGNSFVTKSTLLEDLAIEVCSSCGWNHLVKIASLGGAQNYPS